MTSEEAYVWIWLPGAVDPVVAGRLEVTGEIVVFNYGKSYLENDDAIPLYVPELPLQHNRIRPLGGLTIAGCIKDAGPDAWGQRVIRHKRLGDASRDADPDTLNVLTYLLESGSDRIGALDFQASPNHYAARLGTGTLEEMVHAAELLEAGEPLSPELGAALLHGSSIGGARPKVLLDDGGRKLIAKLSSRTDTYPVVKAEGVAMGLAKRVGLDVAATQVIQCMGHDVLLVERFDRTAVAGERRALVSALTIFELDEMMARYATYHELAQTIRERFAAPDSMLRELFSRVTFNICVGNTDDHARNHAAFWDGSTLTLTPAYDISPQSRSGGEAVQAMEIAPNFRFSQLRGCVDAAHIYHLSRDEATAIIDDQLDVINAHWSDAADAARLAEVERRRLWHRQILNPYALEGYSPGR
jgi:serine/threonine-protein kinase HipA